VAPAGRHEAGLAQDVGGPAPAVQGLDGDGLARGAVPCRDEDAALTLAERPSLRPSYLYPRALAMCRFRPQALGLLSDGGGGDDDVVDHRGDGSGSPGADRRAGAAVFLDHVAERRDPHCSLVLLVPSDLHMTLKLLPADLLIFHIAAAACRFTNLPSPK